MAGVVERPDVLRDPRRFQRGPELAGVPLVLELRAARRMGEDEVRPGPVRARLVVHLELPAEDRGERDQPLPLLALALDDPERRLEHVHVLPAQRLQLEPT